MPGWVHSPALLRRLALAAVVVNVGIVVTGGAVRLTNSGLGCPTWPHCAGDSLVPHAQLGYHGAIEFTNRTLTFVVGLTLLVTLLVALVQRRGRALALVAFLGIPAQAVLGGIVVLTDLNPWLVGAHFLLSSAIIAVAVLLWWKVGDRVVSPVPQAVGWLLRALVGVTALVLAVGTVVTGTGPHAGDLTHGHIRRIGLSTAGAAQLHADLVMILIGLTVGAVVAAHLLHLAVVRTAAVALLGVELAQGLLGYVQYFLHVPAVLVGLHMLGACLTWVAALLVLLRTRASTPATATTATT
ncbi:MAG: COX15/CtaA family protein [Jatrophihabitans sp.]|uniref:COX15/CtaA family protein n=1 Tax=Jatrophihabitans sp. TaxID=1932789 RepID=UPI003F7D8937